MRRMLLLLALAAMGLSCADGPRSTPTTGRKAANEAAPTKSINESLAAAAAFLSKQQSPDGAWRSDVYGTFKDGKALTPLAVVALQAAGSPSDALVSSIVPGFVERLNGVKFLAGLVKSDGTIDEGDGGIDYPVYTASLSVMALTYPEIGNHHKARNAWLKYLLDRQLTENLGWKPGDKPYGGWGYCRVPPRKPDANTLAPPLIESNLSATVFALEALRIAEHNDPKTYQAAALFVTRCQNADGGFHFIYDDPVRNKAGGPSETPGTYHSYGSTTADGLRALRLCRPPAVFKGGLALQSEDEGEALRWLTKHFQPDSHPGVYIPTHERNRNAVYFYYAASLSQAFRETNTKEANGKPWARTLAAALISRQNEDGSWMNPVELVRENDPIVATCNAMIALAECRAAGAK